MKIKTKTTLSALHKQFPDLLTDHQNALNLTISDLTAPAAATAESLVVSPDSSDIETAYQKGARAFITSAKLKTIASTFQDAEFLLSPNPTLALAKISEFLIDDSPSAYHGATAIHPTAVIAETARLGAGVKIGPHAVVGENVELGKNVFIGPSTVIEGDCQIGEGTSIQAHVFIGRRTQIGSHCDIKPNTVIGGPGYGYAHDQKGNHHRIQQLGRVVLEDRVEIGSGCTIDRATFEETRIGAGSKLDNMIHLAHNCKVGRNCLLTGGFMTAGSAILGNNIVTGGRVSVTGHVTICDNVQLGGHSAVGKDITKPGVYAGYPLQPLKDNLRSTATLVLLPKMRKDLVRILKHLGLANEEKD